MSSSPERPRLSIGLAVFNGENYLAEALDSLLAQSYTDLEVVISDNASTDRTPSICAEYAARDPRVRFVRAEVNHGASWNFNNVLALAQGELFKWACHDDICRPDFVARCVDALDRHPDAVLAYTRTRLIDAASSLVQAEVPAIENAAASTPALRFRAFADLDAPVTAFFGVARTSSLRELGPFESYPGADRVLLARLALRGPVIELPTFDFLNRNHTSRYSQSFRTGYESLGWWDASKQGRGVLANWRKLRGLGRSLRSSPSLKPKERIACYWALAGWVIRHHRWLANDVLVAVKVRATGRRNTGVAVTQRDVVPNETLSL